MAKLTQEMQDLVTSEFPFLATADKDGNPQVGPKGSLKVYDDEHLAYVEWTSKTAYENLKATGKAAVAVSNKAAGTGYRFEGTAHVYQPGSAEYKTAKEKGGLGDGTAIVVIDVERIYQLGHVPEAGDLLVEGAPERRGC
ncbi:pyridoxamine 5'-phosphate oxidase family protein [Lactobacillus sp. ESL0679]|uniref:pyridoxamine 5'-phosphate oxidase family protein n=1 Tax=Lactobacillus sp. ESL0679 TaxID=2983209 RepID=UPI0023F8B8CA|nr:pyridoxamine 5'-phosphate oxidase family protein [Lactobacillus sp. ESL0679]MDF7682841.1 pyridoxamine 5'-phosphate oxidase family protein [Lactobacillus sp. ESL0679]